MRESDAHGGRARRAGHPGGPARAARDARELLQIERVASALAVDPLADACGKLVADQFVRVGCARARRPQLAHALPRLRRLDRGGDRGAAAGRRGTRARSSSAPPADAEASGRSARARRRRPTGGRPGRRPAAAAPPGPREGADRLVRPETLVLKPARRRAPPSRTEARRPVRERVPDQLLEAVGAEPRGVVVERGHPDAEGQIALELRSAPDQRHVTRPTRARSTAPQQSRLSGPRFPAHREPAAGANAGRPAQRPGSPIRDGDPPVAGVECPLPRPLRRA